jgi:hypothetical protein
VPLSLVAGLGHWLIGSVDWYIVGALLLGSLPGNLTLPLVTYQAGETVLSAASTTGRLLILKEGAVAVVKEGVGGRATARRERWRVTT